MHKRIALGLALCALAAGTAANAQSMPGGGGGGGPGGGGGGGGHHGGHGGGGGDGGGKSGGGLKPPPEKDKPLDKVEIVGVVQALDPKSDQVTISYEAVDVLNWPAGSMPFVVAKSALLDGVTVGEKVRFKIDSQQISALRPY